MPLTIQDTSEGLVFAVRVQPRASKNQIAGLYGDALKIHLTAPPVDNAANKACAEFLAHRLSVAKSAVTILSGHTGRNKRILVRCPRQGALRPSIRAAIARWTQAV